jgi:hypothetical protein
MGQQGGSVGEQGRQAFATGRAVAGRGLFPIHGPLQAFWLRRIVAVPEMGRQAAAETAGAAGGMVIGCLPGRKSK